jgi:septal ring factor EnvC (AmiA/AmiB activator)
MTSMNELVALRDLDAKSALEASRHEIAICKAHLAASWEREQALDVTIRELRRELAQAHDLLGRVEATAAPLKFPISDWTRDMIWSDSRRVGG